MELEAAPWSRVLRGVGPRRLRPMSVHDNSGHYELGTPMLAGTCLRPAALGVGNRDEAAPPLSGDSGTVELTLPSRNRPNRPICYHYSKSAIYILWHVVPPACVALWRSVASLLQRAQGWMVHTKTRCSRTPGSRMSFSLCAAGGGGQVNERTEWMSGERYVVEWEASDSADNKAQCSGRVAGVSCYVVRAHGEEGEGLVALASGASKRS